MPSFTSLDVCSLNQLFAAFAGSHSCFNSPGNAPEWRIEVTHASSKRLIAFNNHCQGNKTAVVLATENAAYKGATLLHLRHSGASMHSPRPVTV